MAQNEEVSAKLKEALDVADDCFKAENSAGYDALGEQLEELQTMTRESYQRHGDYKSLLDKLEKGNPLTPDEVNTLKQAIVGDAEYYLKYDDDFDRCKAEAGKILDEIRRVQSSDLDVDALMHLSVLCREATRAGSRRLLPGAKGTPAQVRRRRKRAHRSRNRPHPSRHDQAPYVARQGVNNADHERHGAVAGVAFDVSPIR